jgi:predicted nucleic acid-binding protein
VVRQDRQEGVCHLPPHRKRLAAHRRPPQVPQLLGHRFWADTISLSDAQLVDGSRLSSHAQVTDTYLLALAQAHGGRLASMDRKLVTNAVIEGKKALELI